MTTGETHNAGSLDELVRRCPFCRGTSGYYYLAYVKGEQSMTWDDEGIHFEDLETRRGARRCVDCKRVVPPNAEVSHGDGSATPQTLKP